MLNLQAGHFDSAAAGFQRRTMFRIMLGIAGFNVQAKPGDFLSYFDTERAGFELVKGEILAGLVGAGLLVSRAGNAFGVLSFSLSSMKGVSTRRRVRKK